MLVVILGPDGSGKSTIADMLVETLEAREIEANHYAHRFGVLPLLSTLNPMRKSALSSKKATFENSENNYDLRENTPLRALLYVSWYGVDYFLGGLWLRIRNIFGRDRRVAIFARYFYDYYYQSNNRRLPDRIKRLVEFMVPRPDFIFFLERDAQEIHDGKPELPVSEIERQQQIICERLIKYPQFNIIDARKGANQATEQILNILSSRLI